MSAIQVQKLDRLIERFASVEHALSSGATGEAFVKLSKDYAELEPTAKGAMALKSAYGERDGLSEKYLNGNSIDSAFYVNGKREGLCKSYRKSYSYKDSRINASVVYYRIKGISKQGEISYSKIVPSATGKLR